MRGCLRELECLHLQDVFAVLGFLNLATQLAQLILCFIQARFTIPLLGFERVTRLNLARQLGLQ